MSSDRCRRLVTVTLEVNEDAEFDATVESALRHAITKYVLHEHEGERILSIREVYTNIGVSSDGS